MWELKGKKRKATLLGILNAKLLWCGDYKQNKEEERSSTSLGFCALQLVSCFFFFSNFDVFKHPLSVSDLQSWSLADRTTFSYLLNSSPSSLHRSQQFFFFLQQKKKGLRSQVLRVCAEVFWWPPKHGQEHTYILLRWQGRDQLLLSKAESGCCSPKHSIYVTVLVMQSCAFLVIIFILIFFFFFFGAVERCRKRAAFFLFLFTNTTPHFQFHFIP